MSRRFPCKCQSGRTQYALNDSTGVFLGWCCEACEGRLRRRRVEEFGFSTAGAAMADVFAKIKPPSANGFPPVVPDADRTPGDASSPEKNPGVRVNLEEANV